MDKETIKNFINWLDSASDKEIQSRQDKFYRFLEGRVSDESRKDAELGLKLIEEELLARTCLDNLTTK